MGDEKKKMKIFAVFTIFAVNSERIKCWVGEGRSIDEFNENASKVTCGENDLCQMTVRKRGGEVKKNRCKMQTRTSLQKQLETKLPWKTRKLPVQTRRYFGRSRRKGRFCLPILL